MNNVEKILIDLFKKDLITTDEFISYLKETSEINDKTVNFNYDNKNGSNFRIVIPTEIVKSSINRTIEKISEVKKTEKNETSKDDVVKNILNLIK